MGCGSSRLAEVPDSPASLSNPVSKNVSSLGRPPSAVGSSRTASTAKAEGSSSSEAKASRVRVGLVDGEFLLRLSVAWPEHPGTARVVIELPTAAMRKFAGKPAFYNLQERRVLGVGSFGAVKLVVDRTTHVGYALKCMKKEPPSLTGSVGKNWSKAVLRERRVLSSLRDLHHPFVPGLIESYQDRHILYMLLPLVPGDELSTHLRRTKPLNLASVRFYAGCVALAIEFLHSQAIVYRDLKPENLLLDHEGYCKVVDFGFAKVLDPANPRTLTTCGTPEYLAPEIIRGEPHGFAVDWWCVGILVFELIAGYDAFSSTADKMGDTQDDLAERIVNGDYAWPSHSKLHETFYGKPLKRAKEFVAALLSDQPETRLGSLVERTVTRGRTRRGADGAPLIKCAPENVKSHVFWATADQDAPTFFSALKAKSVTPPYIPSVSHLQQPQLGKPNFGGMENPLTKRRLDEEDGDPPWQPNAAEEADFANFSTAWAVPWRREPEESIDFEFSFETAPGPHGSAGGGTRRSPTGGCYAAHAEPNTHKHTPRS